MAFADPEPPDPAEGIATTPSSDNATPTSLLQSQPHQQRVRHEQLELRRQCDCLTLQQPDKSATSALLTLVATIYTRLVITSQNRIPL
ncbi:hypothetical protein F441_10752 [Phytophthora nicotianae CJ01A1]|uniref:Uncharacterized protein n=2 Tax=Phytophthora nicotianae TaxID=4792 RepID=W2Z5L9_PHYNI|nr:hypothetical protein F441_10752 [Phytophthora nicotianae CJ01A1]ETP42360.1 hypothetical protein F442_10727 [Phytophthora nicotianae P10297]